MGEAMRNQVQGRAPWMGLSGRVIPRSSSFCSYTINCQGGVSQPLLSTPEHRSTDTEGASCNWGLSHGPVSGWEVALVEEGSPNLT